MATPAPGRGEVWMADLDPTRGHEQRGSRPVLVLSVTSFNEGPSGLVVILPITSRQRAHPLSVRIVPPEGGLILPSQVLCDQIRSVSTERLLRHMGILEGEAIVAIELRLRGLLGI